MAVEIKELIIRATVDYQQEGGDKGGKENKAASGAEDQDQSALVEACVKQVLKILKQKEQR